MAIASVRKIVNQFTSAVDEQNLYSAVEAESDDSPAMAVVVELAAGANTITKPTDAIGVTIIFAADNDILVTLKGVTGDTGIPLHMTDPTSIGLDSTETTFVLTAADDVTVRLIWS
jgi:hypothetical protein